MRRTNARGTHPLEMDVRRHGPAEAPGGDVTVMALVDREMRGIDCHADEWIGISRLAYDEAWALVNALDSIHASRWANILLDPIHGELIRVLSKPGGAWISIGRLSLEEARELDSVLRVIGSLTLSPFKYALHHALAARGSQPQQTTTPFDTFTNRGGTTA